MVGESDPDAPLFLYGYISHEDGIALVEAQISVAEDEGEIGHHTRGYVNLSDIEWNGNLAW